MHKDLLIAVCLCELVISYCQYESAEKVHQLIESRTDICHEFDCHGYLLFGLRHGYFIRQTYTIYATYDD